ncbi:MAG: 3-phosphoshikimate 1-carboxyvinyltransferase [Pseudoflavonifractor sp.]
MIITITPARLEGTIAPPPSKSQAHRLLIAAGLAPAGSHISGMAESRDISATLDCLAALKAPRGSMPQFDCDESGSTLRFFIPLALALLGGGVFSGRGRLMERPQEPYFELFREKGIAYRQENGTLTLSGDLLPGTYSVRGDISSQFITGLLFALPLLEGNSEIMLTTKLESRGYIDLTLDVLDRFGVRVFYDGDRKFKVPGGQRYRPCDCAVEADWSQAGFFYAANGLGSRVMLEGMDYNSKQGDRVIADYAARLDGGGKVILDVSDCPDLVPALAVRAALRAGESTKIVGAARLRMKESDRLDAVTTELCKLGAQVEQGEDFLLINGVSALTGGRVDSHNDHRIAMMLAIAATRATGPLTLSGGESVAKSYPKFWADYAALGGKVEVLAP